MIDAYTREAENAIPIELVRNGDFDAWLKAQPPADQKRVRQQRFQAKPKQVCWLGGLRGAGAGGHRLGRRILHRHPRRPADGLGRRRLSADAAGR